MARFFDKQGNFTFPRTNIPYDSQAAADNPSFYYRPETAAQNPMFNGGVMNQPVRTAMNQPVQAVNNSQPTKKTGFINQIQSALKNPAVIDAAVMGLNAMRTRPDANIARSVQGRIDTRNQLGLIKAQRNKTAEFLRSKGREDLASAVETGGLDPKSAMALALTPSKQNDDTVLMANVKFLMDNDPNLTFDQAFQKARTNINVDKKAGDAITTQYETLMNRGYDALANLGQTEVLDALLEKAPTGFSASLKQGLKNTLGINVTGGAQEALVAAINKLVPGQRAPGSGTMSDADLELFKSSLPALLNSREGNRIIVQTMKDMINYEVKVGRMAEDVLAGQKADGTPYTRQMFRTEIRNIPDPMALSKQFIANLDQNDDNDGDDIVVIE